MTHEEAKSAWRNREKVTYDGIEYTRISALIYQMPDKGEPILKLQLLDKSNHSVVIANVERVDISAGR